MARWGQTAARACLAAALVAALAGVAGCPAPQATIRIASVNLRDFGYGGEDCKADRLARVAEVLAEYDVISCQEVMRASEPGQECYSCSGQACHLDLLLMAMQTASDHVWACCRTPEPLEYNGRYEYYAIIYNPRTVDFLGEQGLASNVPGSPGFNVRPPFWATFRSASFDFALIDYHAPSNGAPEELAKLAGFLVALQGALPGERDYILAADLNADSVSLPAGWESACDKGIDFVASNPTYTRNVGAAGCGVDHRLVEANLTDHPIVWAEFVTTAPDDD